MPWSANRPCDAIDWLSFRTTIEMHARPLPQSPVLVRQRLALPRSSAFTQNTPAPKRAGTMSFATFPLWPASSPA